MAWIPKGYSLTKDGGLTWQERYFNKNGTSISAKKGYSTIFSKNGTIQLIIIICLNTEFKQV